MADKFVWTYVAAPYHKLNDSPVYGTITPWRGKVLKHDGKQVCLGLETEEGKWGVYVPSSSIFPSFEDATVERMRLLEKIIKSMESDLENLREGVRLLGK